MLKMAVLLSGSGRTLDNFHERIQASTLQAEILVVISNVADALGLEKARNYGYPAFHADNNDDINGILKDYDVDIICLAGYLKLYEPPAELKRAVINIHPALIPSFCGEGFYGHHVHEAVLAKGCTVSGCTVHFANEKYDEGPIILQKSIDLSYDEDADSIASKVFEIECEAFPEAINLVNEKGIDFFLETGGRVSKKERIIMNGEDIDLCLQRMALQIVERNHNEEEIGIVGIHTCGVFLAERLCRLLAEQEKLKIHYGSLDINLYRDDWSLTSVNPVVKTTDIPFDVDNCTLVLVDDVLFTGRTIRAAMDAIMDYGRPTSVQLAVLVDRGGRELPIQADYSGMKTTIRPDERIQVMLEENSDRNDVIIESSEG